MAPLPYRIIVNLEYAFLPIFGWSSLGRDRALVGKRRDSNYGISTTETLSTASRNPSLVMLRQVDGRVRIAGRAVALARRWKAWQPRSKE